MKMLSILIFPTRGGESGADVIHTGDVWIVTEIAHWLGGMP